jgi:deferrochelatase/peroxidase EfeB
MSLLTPEDRKDVQALVLFGTKSEYLRYHFFEIKNALRARDFIGSFLKPGQLAVNDGGSDQSVDAFNNLVFVAFTWPGLQALGLDSGCLASFPTAFREGARRRSPALGGVTPQEAQAWTIADDTVHIAVMLYARDQQALLDQSTSLITNAQSSGCTLVTYVDGNTLPDFTHPDGQRVTRGVHFGFSDGISQPALQGEVHAPGPPTIKPGAFILGHGDPSQPETNNPSLNPPDLGVNGTFGAFRVMEQDCDAFEDFLDRHSHDTQSRELLAARLCGRWRNGVPLALSPDQPTTTSVHRRQLNDFDYVPTPAHPLAANDAAGARCPIGSHVRRSNPRSGEILGNAGNIIRLIRRGMPYGPPHVRGDGKKRGMLGLFLCASIERQFEFVLRHWINDGLFARGLDPAEQDPLIGGSTNGTFSYPAGDGRNQHTVSNIQQFVKTRGAAYLFFPSLTALDLLSRGAAVSIAPPIAEPPTVPPPAMPTEAPSAPTGDPIAAVVENIRARLGKAPFRDAHPKHHGIVRAEFHVLGIDEVEADERERRTALCHGLFTTPRSYTAYIRLSNGTPPRTTPDGFPDLRGMAIKLFNIAGEKLGDEKRTHDFILASAPMFFVKNLGDYMTFLQTNDPAQKARLFPILFQVARSHENPLTTRYFSQTPYACGPEQVKYSVVPESPAEAAPIVLSPAEIEARGSNYLREAMAAVLAVQDVRMRFMMQLAPPGANIDDATDDWKTTPWTTVARIEIPRQEFRSTAQMQLAEDISYNPWHAIEEHKPLGSINETRRRVYLEVSRLRHENGGTVMIEPTGTEL